jgi:hypothetical protein
MSISADSGVVTPESPLSLPTRENRANDSMIRRSTLIFACAMTHDGTVLGDPAAPQNNPYRRRAVSRRLQAIGHAVAAWLARDDEARG